MYIRRVKACIQLAKICHGRINDARCIIRKQFFSDLLYQIDLPYVSQITCVQTVKPKALLLPVFQYSRNIIRQIMECIIFKRAACVRGKHRGWQDHRFDPAC